ncbi:MAG: hypothetical protein LIR10_08370 [Bacillota bacterium]|nr:hypothetical protein [Bacillota bacterium]
MSKKLYIITGLLTSMFLLASCGSESHKTTGTSHVSSSKKISKLEQAKTDVDSLFDDTAHTKLLEGTTIDGIQSTKKEINRLPSSSSKQKLLDDIAQAERLWPAFKVELDAKEADESAKEASKASSEQAESDKKESQYSSKLESKSASITAKQESLKRATNESEAVKEQAKATKNDPESYKTGITYDQIARTPDDHKGQKIYFTGKAIQVLDDDGETQIRLAVDGNYDNVLLVTISNSKLNNSRVLEDDLVNVAGISSGIVKYKSTMGSKISIPSMTAKILQDQGKAPEDYGY